ncbi:gas vesicle protein K [Salipaludibacillus keqinensis]|uniref:Gas vesicle protein K n=2 Tax=Salipaludibacillus keqinensis TaxID=2045207 RepID=A0A323TK08_9BACI|nr:gas vesicle protein K [Salipaludibacillus keqinensis]
MIVGGGEPAHRPTGKIALDPEKAEEGLAQLVMTVMELLRQLVERQAMRRVEGGTLSDEQEEQLGVALMNLEEKMEELKEVFDLDDEDLNIDLGPLGNLL